MRTGILGGTFDPIHLAHLHAAETAMDQGRLDRVLFIPAGEPWQKADREVSAANHRVSMVRLAIDGVPNFELDRREVDRSGPTYTIDTLDSFPANEEIFLIVGSDAAAGLDTWHRSGDVLARVRILIAPRPGNSAEDVAATMPSAQILKMAPLGISSTMIRAMAGEGRPFRYLVPEAVWTYVSEKNLYAKVENRDSVRETTETESSS